MNNLCIIPARGGSKRIPKKNIKFFLGKPIIAYSIEAALASNLFDEVMVSTDDNEIAEIAKQFGAKVPFLRSKINANDFATTFDVIEEVVNKYKRVDLEFENVCCIYACAPFVDVNKLEQAYKKLIKYKFDSVFPVLKFSYPIQRALKIFNQRIEMFYTEFLSTRSQDLEPAFHDAGQFYWLNTEKLLMQKKIFTDNSGFIKIDEIEGQDIDTIQDWKLAEIKYKVLHDDIS
jgi:N-acylneuraminate cytidylyltransferase